MSADSRTARSLKNSIVALGFYFINLILQFVSRKIFLDHLGIDVLGLNTTATNLLQFLNLAELGVGTAIACTLYKPLFDRDSAAINEIVSLQGWMYRRIAWFVIVGSLLLMISFPWIFAKMVLPLWYAYASFGVLLVSALLSYFVNYKQILLSADQKEYKIQYSYKTSMLVKVLCQIISVKYFNNGYVWWLALEVVFAIVASVVLNRVIQKTYPYLRTDLSRGKVLSVKYPEIILKIKQLFFHKIGGFALSQTSPIIIYAYASLSLVALYGNYMMIILGGSILLGAVFNSMNAGIGNLVAEGNNRRILEVFEELFSVRFLLSCIMCFGVYILTPAFITLWIGTEYVLDDFALILMVAILFINLTRLTVDAYINAYGLFSDIWAPVIEASINVGMSILLGYFFGLHGILTGVFLSLFVVIFCWKPYFLFRKGLKGKLKLYLSMYAKHLIAAFACVIVTLLLMDKIEIDFAAGWGKFILGGAAVMSCFSLLLLFSLLGVTRGMRRFIHRICN